MNSAKTKSVVKPMNGSKNKLNSKILLIYNSFLSVYLPTDDCAYCIFLDGPTALFMNQPTLVKCNNSVLPFKNYFATIFSAISFQFLAK